MTWHIFILALLLACTGQAHAQAVVKPIVSGVSTTGFLMSPAGSFTMTPANDGFIKPAALNVGGRAATIPATLRMAANAGQYAKQAMRLNPYVLAGTLAAGWLLDQGLSYENDQWVKANTSGGLGYDTCTSGQIPGTQTEAYMRNAILSNPQNHWYGCNAWHDCSVSNGGTYCQGWGGSPANLCAAYQCTGQPNPQTEPATDADWDALPSPLPIIAPELPYAPYMPEGVPVNAPEYAPSDISLGQPYTRPDGSTAEPRAKISPAGDGKVTVAPYDQPLTDPQGNPTPGAQPQPTTPTQPDPCEANPTRIGCMDAGNDSFPMPTGTHSFEYNSEASPIGNGSCPAPISVLGHQISYAPACSAMTTIKPVVLGMASLMAAYILFGGFRGNN